MKNIKTKVLLALLATFLMWLSQSCNRKLDVQTVYPFTIDVMPVKKTVELGKAIELRCVLSAEGEFADSKYTIRHFLYDGEGKLVLGHGEVMNPNDRYDLNKGSFRLYYTPIKGDKHSLEVVVEDNQGQSFTLNYDFAIDKNKGKE